jgi:transaldolase
MKFFLDTARLDEVEAAASLGFVDGVTTNAALLAEARVDAAEFVPEACTRMRGTLSVPVRGDDADAIVEAASALAQLDDRVLIKIPVHAEGLRAMSRLRGVGVRTHATLCCSANQALLAAKCGAYYVSPLVGRVEEWGGSGAELVGQIIEVFDNYEFETQVMVASVRSAAHVQDAALLGADACTLPWSVLQDLSRHPQTEALLALESRARR